MRRFYLNFSGLVRNLDEPKTIIVCTRMSDLQLSDLNSRHFCLKPLNNMVNVA